ncbi:MAG: type I-D CRISPR-associated protein Cas5/Csc1 [Leptolyngbya sp. SIO4C1]|nr:type I-D CRISPR-associated protein Cas5/Csc1 [Leptolyngbya sp. SIO4C1]
MPQIYRCTLELHDSLYYATREIGRLYETEPVLHNYALCYALGLVDSEQYATTVPAESSYRYFCSEQVPMYEAHLTPLNQQGIYVTPAKAIRYSTVLHTWKYADNRYHVEMQKTKKNIPSFGRAKEIAPESQFECFVISTKPLTFPRWIRLGKWMSKAKIEIDDLGQLAPKTGEILCAHPLNPLDVMFTHRVISYDVINMPPVSLIRNVKLEGAYFQTGEVKLPACMSYRFSD